MLGNFKRILQNLLLSHFWRLHCQWTLPHRLQFSAHMKNVSCFSFLKTPTHKYRFCRVALFMYKIFKQRRDPFSQNVMLVLRNEFQGNTWHIWKMGHVLEIQNEFSLYDFYPRHRKTGLSLKKFFLLRVHDQFQQYLDLPKSFWNLKLLAKTKIGFMTFIPGFPIFSKDWRLSYFVGLLQLDPLLVVPVENLQIQQVVPFLLCLDIFIVLLIRFDDGIPLTRSKLFRKK